MHVRCPDCHHKVDVVADDASAEMSCPSCGSKFSIAGERGTTWLSSPVKRIGQFELIEQVGIGQFGCVWKAKDVELDRIVAIKLPRKEHLDDTDVETIFREARAAASLRHHNIVPVHEVGREGSTVYLVSDFVAGCTLKEWLTAQRMTIREAAQLAEKIARALDHAHESGVVHRDLKPGNIMLDMKGEPHLTDFGLARRDSGEITVTVDGCPLGTPAYMSPEQARGDAHRADRRTDVYSLGVVLFELLTGELPFRGDSRMLIVQILKDEPPSPRKLNNRIPRDLETICLKCLQKNPDRRYRTALDAADDLAAWLAGRPIKARPVGRVERFVRWTQRQPVVAALSALVLLVTITGFAAVSWQLWKTSVAEREAKKNLDDSNEQRRRRDENFQSAMEAVDTMLTQVGEQGLGNIPEAREVRKQLLEHALKVYEGLADANSDRPEALIEAANASKRVGAINWLLGKGPEALDAYDRAIATLKALEAKQHTQKQLADLVKTMVQKVQVLQIDHQQEESLKVMAEARQLTRGLADDGTTTSLNLEYDIAAQYAHALRDLRRNEEAAEAYRQCFAIADREPPGEEYCRNSVPYFRGMRARLLSTISGREDEALEETNRAIEEFENVNKRVTKFYYSDVPIAQKHTGKNLIVLRQQQAVAAELAASILRALMRQDEAEGYEKRARDYLIDAVANSESILAKDPKNLLELDCVATMSRALGGSHARHKEHAAAAKSLRKSLDTFQKLAAREPGQTWYVAMIPTVEAELRHQLSQLPPAERPEPLESAKTPVITFAPQTPEEDLKALKLLDLRLHKLRSEGQLKDLEADLMMAVAIADRLASREPSHPEVPHALGWTHSLLGDCLSQTQGRSAESLAHYTIARANLEACVAKNGIKSQHAISLAWTCTHVVRINLQMEGDPDLVQPAIRGLEVRLQMQNEGRAVQNLESLLENSLSLLSEALLRAPQVTEADLVRSMELASQYQAHRPESGESWKLVGICHFLRNEYAQCLEVLGKPPVTALKPPSIVQCVQAMANHRTGKTTEAETLLEAAKQSAGEPAKRSVRLKEVLRRAETEINSNAG